VKKFQEVDAKISFKTFEYRIGFVADSYLVGRRGEEK
jgi:hypothetical protein